MRKCLHFSSQDKKYITESKYTFCFKPQIHVCSYLCTSSFSLAVDVKGLKVKVHPELSLAASWPCVDTMEESGVWC